ncbi:ferredoxin [archaeon]|jgi:ferredoxin|nr:ferredoxin [archaeon]MBT4397110.1 ferredoxin [archaeon]MBT4441163.1 ferredoxin [archaeon]
MYKVKQDREKCIGCGGCVAVCGENWEMGSDNKSKPKKTDLEEIGCNQKAADACPVGIIIIEEVESE